LQVKRGEGCCGFESLKGGAKEFFPVGNIDGVFTLSIQ